MERILVIDDDVELCHLVGEYLQAEGFAIECVHDGESGLKKATAGEYLLVVLDVMLPGINGFEVLRRIRATSRLPVLLLTAMIICRSLSTPANWWRASAQYCAAPMPTAERCPHRIWYAWVKWNLILQPVRFEWTASPSI
jgi:CheY-like chemotaxis protein